MSKPRLLDLFCGAGIGSRGYQRAGFHVTGVDIVKQPRYAGDVFVQADALNYLVSNWHTFDAVHASPLCQPHSAARRLSPHAREYYDYIPLTRYWLEVIDLPYVIENVEGARKALRNPIMLCGAMFPGLKIYHHRLFESSIMLYAPPHRPHDDDTPPAGRGRSSKGFFSLTSGGITGVSKAERLAGAGVDWYVTNAELNQSFPPQFTEYIGRQLLNHVLYQRELRAA